MISFTFICKKIIHILLNKSQPLNNPCQQMSRKYRYFSNHQFEPVFPIVDISINFMRNGVYDCNLLIIQSNKPPNACWTSLLVLLNVSYYYKHHYIDLGMQNLNNFSDIKRLMEQMEWGIAEYALEGLLSKCLSIPSSHKKHDNFWLIGSNLSSSKIVSLL